MSKHISRAKKRALARRMKSKPTPAEAVLWEHIRDRRLGYRFKRQAIVSGFILDFYCPSRLLGVEVDGSSHDGRAAYDLRRTHILNKKFIHIIRFTNDDVLHDIGMTVKTIKEALDA